MNRFAKKIGTEAVSAALALGLCGTMVLASGSAAPTAQAASSTYIAASDSYINLKLPKVWSAIIGTASTSGHTSGAWHTDFYVTGSNYGYMPIRFDGGDMGSNGKIVKGKTTVKWGKIWSNCHGWIFENEKAGNKGWVTMSNIYLDAWENAHGENTGVSKAIWKKLVKEVSQGKVGYAKVVKWSRSKAESKGEKAVKSYVKACIAPRVSLR